MHLLCLQDFEWSLKCRFAEVVSVLVEAIATHFGDDLEDAGNRLKFITSKANMYVPIVIPPFKYLILQLL